MVMPELVLIVKRKVVIRLKNPMNGCQTECWSNGVGGEPLWRVQKDLAYFFQPVEGQNIGLNRRLPQITQRDVLSSGWLDYSISSTRDKPCVETFVGAAC
jgi:hypothetical protein